MQKQLTIKILTVFFIGIVILIPIKMVESKIFERSSFQAQATNSVAESWTGPQSIVTPVVIIPYRISVPNAKEPYKNMVADRFAVVLPDQVSGSVNIANKKVSKGIYSIPVYNSDLLISGQYSAHKIQDALERVRLDERFESVGKPYLSVHIADVRGLDKNPSLMINDSPIALEPGSRLASLTSGISADLPFIEQAISFELALSLRGMERWSFLPAGDDVSVSMQSDWPHPAFIGASLPLERQISADGFSANWQSTRYANNSMPLLKQCLETNNCHGLTATTSGVDFIEPVDIYLQTERSIKYAVLFIGLSFITFFIFEYVKTVRIHPIQYTFVGLCIAVFYLLLISLAEHVAFIWAYSIAAASCSLLLLFYVRYLLKQLAAALLFFTMVVSLYGLLYVIVQAEDFALLMGAMLVFIVLAVLMIVTRNIDWYRASDNDSISQ